MADEIEMSPEEQALEEATRKATEAAAALIDAQRALAVAKRRPASREEAEERLATAQQQLADKEKPGQDLENAKHALATSKSAMENRPTGLTDEDWDDMRERISKRIPGQETALDNASLAFSQFNVSAGEIDAAVSAVHEAQDFLAAFDEEKEEG